jgi:hypothetical protein
MKSIIKTLLVIVISGKMALALEPLFYTRIDYIVGSEPSSVCVADLDGDGIYDLASANSTSNNVSILRGNGDGTFQAPVNYGAGNVPWSVFAADLDNDGDSDLAVANRYSSNVSILKNDGDATFQTAANYRADSS